MTSTPIEIGTLIAVVLKAKNLPNKRHIGKQDPYCCVLLNGEKRRTKAIKRGGQHPEWDEEVRFTLYEDLEDELARTANARDDTPPPPPPKDGKKKKKIKGGKLMTVQCYADDPKEPDLIGETVVDLTEALTTGETDEWFTLSTKEKNYCGEVYLELTFWSNEKPPEKKTKNTPVKHGNQYGGPGSFVPLGDNGGGPTNGLGRDSVPASLRSSDSLAKLDLYIPPYENATIRSSRRQHGSALEAIADEFGGLNLDGHRRRESFPPLHGGHASHHSLEGFSTIQSLPSTYQTGDYNPSEYSDGSSSFSYQRSETPTGRGRYRQPSAGSYQEYRPPYEQPHQQYESSVPYHVAYNTPPHRSSFDSPSRGSLPPVPSGFVPVPSPATSSFFPVSSSTPGPLGYGGYGAQAASLNTSAPTPYPPQPSHTPAPSGFMPPSQPQSSMGFHSQQPPQQQSYQYPPYPPASAPPQPYPPPPPAPPQSVPPQSQSAPPQQFYSSSQPLPQPPPPPQGTPGPYPPYPPSTPSPPAAAQVVQYSSPAHTPGSRPLPQPGQQQFYSTPNGSSGGQSPVQSFPTASPYNPNPPPPPPPLTQNPASTQQHYQPSGFTSNPGPPPPPPPPPIRANLPPPPPPPPQLQYQQNGAENVPAARPALPQPPVNYQQQGQQGSAIYQPVPPPPPPPSFLRHVSVSQSYPLPTPPQTQQPINVNGTPYFPPPPPRPPVQLYEQAQWSQ
ncbi:hypothetical protein BD410DRAFT_779668 [Rickenella mellea]|uniref:C2 domain-containing protein n=1 Tax=Rickenella mellea TaxID=50990 RepID=A0A4R5XDY4_9AGAM|nr:hypothetical protein BD410DRAFT_779668 [Rickenella mellea]